MKEYKIYTTHINIGSRESENIEQKLNDFAKQGYHVISVTNFTDFYLAFTLERNIPDEE